MCHQQLVILFFLLLLATPLEAIWELEKNVYVVEVEWHPDAPAKTVVLTCDSSEKENTITWTSNKNGQILGTGKTLTVKVREFTDAGSYICQKGGEVLSRKLLLIRAMEDGVWSTDIVKEQKEPKPKTYLKCEAKNYSGTFTCSWLTESSRDLKFSIRSSKGSSDPRGVTCGPAVLSEEKIKIDKEYRKYTADCQEASACPSAEESKPIEVVVHAIQKHKYEKYTSSFYIRDIIKPDPPRNLRVKSLKNSKTVELSWEYPETWSTPHSYFPLNFGVQGPSKGKKEKNILTTDTTSAHVDCHRGKEILVKAKDRYYNSSWSQWASVSC